MSKLRYERVPVKLNKAEVEYTNDHGDSDEQCAKCAHYLTATTCQIVAGRISPEGWCDQFEGRDHESVEYADGGEVEYQRPIYGGSLKGAFKLPRSAIIALGHGDAEAGQTVADEMFGHHLALGHGVVHPLVVAHLGNGDLAAGHHVLRKFVTTLRHRGEP